MLPDETEKEHPKQSKNCNLSLLSGIHSYILIVSVFKHSYKMSTFKSDLQILPECVHSKSIPVYSPYLSEPVECSFEPLASALRKSWERRASAVGVWMAIFQ